MIQSAKYSSGYHSIRSRSLAIANASMNERPIRCAPGCVALKYSAKKLEFGLRDLCNKYRTVLQLDVNLVANVQCPVALNCYYFVQAEQSGPSPLPEIKPVKTAIPSADCVSHVDVTSVQPEREFKLLNAIAESALRGVLLIASILFSVMCLFERTTGSHRSGFKAQRESVRPVASLTTKSVQHP